MGMIKKAVIGSLIVGAGAFAISQNKKAVESIRKSFDKTIKKIMSKPASKKPRSINASKPSKVAARSKR